jgi:hypothetical protein
MNSSYLRFTPEEFRAISQVCRPLDFGGDSFDTFQPLLVDSLADRYPELASRIAGFRSHQLALLYCHMGERRASKAKAMNQEAEPESYLSFEELHAIWQASHPSWPCGGFHPSFKKFLMAHFASRSPHLRWKLARFTERQMKRLFHQVKQRRRWAG